MHSSNIQSANDSTTINSSPANTQTPVDASTYLEDFFSTKSRKEFNLAYFKSTVKNCDDTTSLYDYLLSFSKIPGDNNNNSSQNISTADVSKWLKDSNLYQDGLFKIQKKSSKTFTLLFTKDITVPANPLQTKMGWAQLYKPPSINTVSYLLTFPKDSSDEEMVAFASKYGTVDTWKRHTGTIQNLKSNKAVFYYTKVYDNLVKYLFHYNKDTKTYHTYSISTTYNSSNLQCEHCRFKFHSKHQCTLPQVTGSIPDKFSRYTFDATKSTLPNTNNPPSSRGSSSRPANKSSPANADITKLQADLVKMKQQLEEKDAVIKKSRSESEQLNHTIAELKKQFSPPPASCDISSTSIVVELQSIKSELSVKCTELEKSNTRYNESKSINKRLREQIAVLTKPNPEFDSRIKDIQNRETDLIKKSVKVKEDRERFDKYKSDSNTTLSKILQV